MFQSGKSLAWVFPAKCWQPWAFYRSRGFYLRISALQISLFFLDPNYPHIFNPFWVWNTLCIEALPGSDARLVSQVTVWVWVILYIPAPGPPLFMSSSSLGPLVQRYFTNVCTFHQRILNPWRCFDFLTKITPGWTWVKRKNSSEELLTVFLFLSSGKSQLVIN